MFKLKTCCQCMSYCPLLQVEEQKSASKEDTIIHTQLPSSPFLSRNLHKL